MTRELILDAARTLFAENGYDGATIRAIAQRAGVDPAMIRHFFGDKASLFAVAVASRSEVAVRLRAALSGEREGVGRRVADAYLHLWEDAEVGVALRALLRSGIEPGRPTEPLLAAIGASNGTPIPIGQVLAGTHLLGVAFARFVAEVPAIVVLEHDDLVDLVGPAIQRYLAPEGADGA